MKSLSMFYKKRIALAVLVGLVVFLICWILFYPWEQERINVQSEESGKTQSYAEKLMKTMSLKEKIYQMFIVSPEQITGVKRVTAAGSATREAVNKYPVGGIIYSKPNMLSKEQIAEVISNTQSYSQTKLFIAVDEEGGKVNRLMDSVGTTFIDSMYSYRNKGEKTAKTNAQTIARDIRSLGFNLDFAPVADVWSNPDNTVISDRAYSDDFQTAAKLVCSAVEGFKEEGVLCTLKHFPGHGDTSEDSHTGMAYVNKTLKELREEEFLPFGAGIDEGADFVMVGHLMANEIDHEYPASLSEKVIGGIIRDELGFEGIVITDSLQMSAITDNYTNAETAVLAVKAGNDILLEPEDLEGAVTAIEHAVSEGEISEECIDEHVERILATKITAGIIEKKG